MTQQAHKTAPTDVLIVGAGVAGAVAAVRLAEGGARVVCLEQGDWPDHRRARAGLEDFELTALRDWDSDPNVRRAPADYPIDDAESPIAVQCFNAVGGSAIGYAAQWHRSLPSDFRTRSLDGVGDDWPMTYEDLLPFYRRVERDFAVSGLAGDPAYPVERMALPLPPVALGSIGERIAAAHNRLSWHWWPGINAIATRPYRGLEPCRELAACPFGCPAAAKATPDRTLWPRALSAGATLRTGARVRRIETDRRGRAIGALYVDRDGKEHLSRATVTVLAANGIGTPRLLLLSGGPDGLANSTGLVGRRLMLHPFAMVTGYFDSNIGTTRGVSGEHAYSLQFYETDERRGFVRGAKWGLAPTGGPLFAALDTLEEREIWGSAFLTNVRRRLGRTATWGIIAEDLPDEANRVVLHSDLTDGDGVSAPKIIYHLSDNSSAMLRYHTTAAAESMRAAGAYDTHVTPLLRSSGWHMLGTACMGDDPKRSVVDRWGYCHEVPNLYVIDGSIWPTSSGVNPTATIAAVALRNTEHLLTHGPARRASL
jgi:choline dehydrogenase-like flavoprotein